MSYGEADIVGNRKLPRQRCLDMDWSNKKEITAWEIAWCLLEYSDIKHRFYELEEERQFQVMNEYIPGRLKHIKNNTKIKINEEKQTLIDEYSQLDIPEFNRIKTEKQLECIKRLIDNDILKEIATFVSESYSPRDTKRYDEDLKSYVKHLTYAYKTHKKYLLNTQDQNDKDTVDFLFQKLFDLGLPKPMTIKDTKKDIFNIYSINMLKKTGIATTPATKLAKQITKIHFSR